MVFRWRYKTIDNRHQRVVTVSVLCVCVQRVKWKMWLQVVWHSTIVAHLKHKPTRSDSVTRTHWAKHRLYVVIRLIVFNLVLVLTMDGHRFEDGWVEMLWTRQQKLLYLFSYVANGVGFDLFETFLFIAGRDSTVWCVCRVSVCNDDGGRTISAVAAGVYPLVGLLFFPFSIHIFSFIC